MKYLPLIWSALRRKPLRAILTLLSVTVAFTLFGLMVGMNASIERIMALARRDIVFVSPRFGGDLPASLAGRLTRLPNVGQAGKASFPDGYFQDPKNPVYPIMIDTTTPDVWDPLPMTPERLKRLAATRDGVFFSRSQATRWHRKADDIFTMISPSTSRADGTKTWRFQVLEVLDDVPAWTAGFIVGNYDYYDKSRPLAAQGKADFFQLLVRDGTRASETGVAIDRMFANSGAPTVSIPESVAYQSGWSGVGVNIALVTHEIAGLGLFMILLLVGNGIAQSVRERIPEFAMLKTLGFSDGAVMALVFVEVAIPCLAGAVIGIALAAALSTQLPKIFPPGQGIPIPYLPPAILGWALGAAALVAFASAIAPALRLRRLDVAAALSRG